VIWFKEMEARGYPPDQKAKNILLSLAKTPEEQEEANELVGNGAIQLEVKPYSEEVDDADEHEITQTDSGTHRLLDDTPARNHVNGRISAGNYAFDEDGDEDDDDDDDYEEEDGEEFDFVSFKDKRELNFAS
jgi:hypothetical protein